MTDETKSILARIQVENICKLLGGKVEYYQCSDLKTTRQKIVIEYNVKQK